jgi:hypothetical protein
LPLYLLRGITRCRRKERGERLGAFH